MRKLRNYRYWSKRDKVFALKHLGKKPLNWVADKLGRSMGSTQDLARRVLGVSTHCPEYRLLIGKKRAIFKASVLKGTRIQLWCGAKARYTGNVLERWSDSGPLRRHANYKPGLRRRQRNYRPELQCEANGHLFIAPTHNTTPMNCLECVSKNGGKKKWGLLLATANKYGLKIDTLLKIRKAQTHSTGVVCCFICSRPESNEKLCVDHNHSCCRGEKSCGQCVRKLLCRACNWVIGLIESNKIPKGFAPAHDSYINKFNKIKRRKINGENS